MTKLALGMFATALIAAQTIQPGQMTQARVWIQNRGRAEAVPVDLRDANLDAPLRVRVVGLQNTDSSIAPVIVRPTRQVWEYETIDVPDGQDVEAILNGEGAGGWETTGIALQAPSGLTLVLKRPR